MEKEPRPIARITDIDTGEVLDILVEGDRVQKWESRQKQQEYLDTTDEVPGDFIKVISEKILPILQKCKDKKGKVRYDLIVLLFYLMNFISYRTGLLLHPNGRKLTVRYIIEDENLGMGRTKVFENLGILKDLGIIANVSYEGDVYIMFNPFIAYKGKRVDLTTMKVFMKSE